METTGLRFGNLNPPILHLCIDMQRLFAEPTQWYVPDLATILPTVEQLADYLPGGTIFTKFITAKNPEGQVGRWHEYYQRWSSMTLSEIEPALLNLVPALEHYAEDSVVIDKYVFNAFENPKLDDEIRHRNTRTLIFSGVETDMCVLATVLAAVDRGYRCIIMVDGVASSDPDGHNAVIEAVFPRFNQHIETATLREILDAWRVNAS
jgi:nicotinamidase-related amidase